MSPSPAPTPRSDAMVKTSALPGVGRPVSGSAALTVFAVVAALYFAREVLVPLALAVLLSFVLAPGATLLRRWHVGRVTSVLIMVAFAFMVIFSLGAVITQQMTTLGANLPQYEYTIRSKLRSLEQAASASGLVERASQLLHDLRNEIKVAQPAPPAGSSAPNPNPAPEPVPVRIQNPAPGPLEVIQSVFGRLLGPLATAGLVIIYAIFILLQREDLRDRLIRLMGTRDLNRTTQAITDAAYRVSRFLTAQTILNALYGAAIGIGLWIIGVPNPILWGILVMALRFVPYVGWIIAAAFPLILSLATAPGWSMVLWTAALFVAIELTVGYGIEPWFFGNRVGLSAFAVLVAAIFWTWLWGPIGLLVSTPLTACLATLGRHVPHLEFLDVVLGDQPVLDPEESFYQRLLTGDASGAVEQAEKYLKEKPLSLFYDEVVLAALALAQADLERDTLDGAAQARLLATLQDVIDYLADYDDVVPAPEPSLAARVLPESVRAEQQRGEPRPTITLAPHVNPADLPPEWRQTPVHCIASRNDLDEAVAEILATLLTKHGVGAEPISWRSLSGASAPDAEFKNVRILCLSCLGEQVSAYLKFLVRRLRRRYPGATVIVGFWSMRNSTPIPPDRLAEIGADLAVSSLRETLMIVCQKAVEPVRSPAPSRPQIAEEPASHAS